ncbi:hypothetical protein PTSG_10181 [Salpingoeca rosetta]|uniref:Uncharacterized protein n=1 Tax=Salpingoeca rosetta (strain ATCC 50818 / BSB-021) TaxID=946362 RepID=F2UQJ2_SALR5|nr:uncharacterized protein PTSG_10181 [Salpingoeca rosetta]EGD79897.1 hypothetical protein PTSG_10181 [Salpingoeca rosetta]|eukprot:XP_004988518.1 hypothetical protein PTSG_10181 [Salpingoeca rosetta]
MCCARESEAKEESAPSDKPQDAVADTLQEAITPLRAQQQLPMHLKALTPSCRHAVHLVRVQHRGRMPGAHGIVSCGPAGWHRDGGIRLRAGEALQPSSPASARRR